MPDAQGPALPDRVCISSSSKFHDKRYQAIGVRFKGVEKRNVFEYCVSERWVRLIVGHARTKGGDPMTMKLQGDVHPYWRF